MKAIPLHELWRLLPPKTSRTPKQVKRKKIRDSIEDCLDKLKDTKHFEQRSKERIEETTITIKKDIISWILCWRIKYNPKLKTYKIYWNYARYIISTKYELITTYKKDKLLEKQETYLKKLSFIERKGILNDLWFSIELLSE